MFAAELQMQVLAEETQTPVKSGLSAQLSSNRAQLLNLSVGILFSHHSPHSLKLSQVLSAIV